MTPTAADDEQVMLVVHLDARPGVQARMSDALARLAEATRRTDRGVIRFEIGLDPTDDTRVVGYEIWESQDALAEHAAKAHTQQFLAEVRDLVVDPAKPLRAERLQPLSPETPASYAASAHALRAPAAEPTGFRTERRKLGDAEFHYVIGGSGPLAVLLHGFPNSWYAWREVMSELAQTMTVLALDLRGLGDSEAGTQPNDVPTGARDLALLLDELGLGPGAKVSLSTGSTGRSPRLRTCPPLRPLTSISGPTHSQESWHRPSSATAPSMARSRTTRDR